MQFYKKLITLGFDFTVRKVNNAVEQLLSLPCEISLHRLNNEENNDVIINAKSIVGLLSFKGQKDEVIEIVILTNNESESQQYFQSIEQIFKQENT